MSSERSVREEFIRTPLPQRLGAYPTSTNIHTPTRGTTVTTSTRAGTATSFLSPLKRKRDRSPFEIPETPWRLQSAPAEEEDEEGSEVVEVEVDDVDDTEVSERNGQVSPRSRKLATQLEDLSLAATGPLFTLLPQGGGDLEMDTAVTIVTEEEEPAAKKPKRRIRTTTTIAADGVRMEGVGMAKVGVDENGDASMNGNGSGNTEPEVTVKRKGAGGEWEDEPLTGSFERKEEEGEGEMRDNTTNTTTKRARLQSPPLSKTRDFDGSDDDGAAVVDESEDVDSDDPEQFGIGYRPTPTQRYVRSQKRMQQIKEYKARISKEAREKRSESRRRRRSFPDRYPVAAGSGAPNDGSGEGGRKKTVQFKIDPAI